ncbi:MAG TPA: MaoC/PaaZ C-terminal domain-containing protein [Microvirga sp.]|jgi:acyl dehydratase|nr:MaoC/PaaZ C-terminal domain-containing protein [Microvirga sp.]
MGMYDRYKSLDEMSEGEKFWSHGRTVTETDCVIFTSLAGLKAPLFVDAEYASKHGKFGKRLVPGLLTAAFTAGMMEDILGPYALAALELRELKFLKPVFHNDTVNCIFTVQSIDHTSTQDTGVLTALAEMFKQDREKVFEWTGVFLMKRTKFDSEI